jgi:hypothetical protein
MTQRVLGPSGSKRRRRFLIVPLVLVAVGALLLAGAAQAVHDEAFQLDGDVLASTTTSYGGHTQSVDWDSIFTATGANKDPLPTNFTAAGFKQDFLLKSGGAFDTTDNTTYTQGSKDIDNVAAWVCATANNVTNKGDIMNAYAAAYTDPVSGDQKIYFALERSSNNGDANVGFWFLQDGTANCDATNGTTNFTGNHQDGDIFIVAAFTKGGDVGGITAYRWTGGANGSLGPVTDGSGGDCRTSATSLGDKICAVSNEVTISQIPWLTNKNGQTTGLGHSLDQGEFFEGGINLTKTNLAGKCFNTFVANTRSSQETTATLYDFARGSLGECKTTLSTQENKAASSSIGTGVVSSGTDTATLTITGASTWGGTLTWYLCGPIASPTLCDAHGVQVTSRTVSESSLPSDFISGTANLTSVGRYCWHAHFEPNDASKLAGVKAADDDGSNECFTITPVTPSLMTSATCSASPCILGSTLSDTASLTGTASGPGTNGPGGDTGLYKSINATNGPAADSSISWTLYGPAADGSAQCTTPIANAPTPSSVTVIGDNPSYGPVTYTTTASDGLGTYTFAASYPGQSPNTNAAPAVACADGATNGEQVTVTSQANTTTAQKWLPQDTATVTASGGATVAGNVTFSLYESADCSGTAVTFGPIAVDSNGQATTNNQTYYTTVKTISWRATFTSTNGVDSGPQSHCETMSVSTLNNDIGS